MSISVKNVNSTSNWDAAQNANTCKIEYNLSDTDTVIELLDKMEKWLCGFKMVAPTAAVNVDGQVSIQVSENVLLESSVIPTSGTLILWNMAGQVKATTTFSAIGTTTITNDTFTIPALASGFTWAAGDFVSISGNYGDRGWRKIGEASTSDRGYKALNLGGSEAGDFNNWKYMNILATVNDYMQFIAYGYMAGATLTSKVSYAYNATSNSYNGQRVDWDGIGAIWLAAAPTHMIAYCTSNALASGSLPNGTCCGTAEYKRVNPSDNIQGASTSDASKHIQIHSGMYANYLRGGLTLPVSPVSPHATSTYVAGLTSFGAFGSVVGDLTEHPLLSQNSSAGIPDVFSGKYRVSDLFIIDRYGGINGLGPLYNIKMAAAGTLMDEVDINITDGEMDVNGATVRCVLIPIAGVFSFAVPK